MADLNSQGSARESSPSHAILKFFQCLLDFLMRWTENIGAFLLAVMTLIVFWQVITRFKIVNLNSPWTEEIALMLLVWFGLTGAAIGIRTGSHIAVEFITTLFPEKVQKWLNIIIYLLILAFSVFLFNEGLNLAKETWGVLMSATLLSRGIFVYLAIPTAALLMVIYSLEHIIKQVIAGGRRHV